MIALIADVLSWFFLLSGASFCVIGGIGLIRMPDFYSRTHAASLGDTLGAGLIVVGLALQAPSILVVTKLLFTLAFLWVTGPIATHALVKAAYARGIAVNDPHHEAGSTGEGAAHAD